MHSAPWLADEAVCVGLALARRREIEHEENAVCPLLHPHILAKFWDGSPIDKSHDAILDVAAWHPHSSTILQHLALSFDASA